MTRSARWWRARELSRRVLVAGRALTLSAGYFRREIIDTENAAQTLAGETFSHRSDNCLTTSAARLTIALRGSDDQPTDFTLDGVPYTVS
ncbi:hypothetical protein ACIBO5_54785 [Nonomuraea angiospora]|uniref:hypothetical protein n=1 Tax=Nonomuraea angiospora TaxID=46172 RepID=UPI0029A05B8D|nr:hypothetical protein [Nonomuraea angiospora]MDX3099571.1 hypothetical protein [Nonomuraea angiospora]